MKLYQKFGIAYIAVVAAVVGAYTRCAPQKPRGATAPASTFASVPTGPNGAGNCPLGWYQKDPNSSTCSTAFGWTPVYSDAATTVFPIQNLAPSDFDFVTVFVHAQVPNSLDQTGEGWWRVKWGLKYQSDSGSFADPAGGTAGTAVDSQVGSQLSGCAPTLVQTGGQLGVSFLCGVAAVAVEGNVDWDRSSLAPWVLSVSPAMAYDIPGAPIAVAITTTPGGAQYVTAGTVNGISLQNCSQVSDHVATCNLPPGTYTPGVGSVCLTSQAAPFCLPNGFTLDAAVPADGAVPDSGPGPTLANFAPLWYWQGADGGGLALTFQGTNLSGCTGATICGNAATSVSCTSTSVTMTPPANAPDAAGCAVTVTTPSGTSPAPDGGVMVTPIGFGPCFVAAEGVDAAAPMTWADFINGKLAGSVGATAPSLNPSWTGGQPAVESDAATTALYVDGGSASGTLQPGVYFAVAQVNNASTTPGFFSDPGDNIGLQWLPSTAPELYNVSTLNGPTMTPTTPFEIEVMVYGNDSGISVNNGAITTGNVNTAETLNSMILMGQFFAGTYHEGTVGDIGIFCQVRSAVTTTATEDLFNAEVCKVFGTPCNAR